MGQASLVPRLLCGEGGKRNEARDKHEQAIDASSFEPRLSVSELVSQLGKKIAIFLLSCKTEISQTQG